MTIHIQDLCFLEDEDEVDEEHEICVALGEGLFRPEDAGIDVRHVSTAETYWRHFACQGDELFLVQLHVADQHGRYPRIDGVDAVPDDPVRPWGFTYAGLRMRQAFTGGLLLGRGLIDDVRMCVAMETPSSYEIVTELLFEDGRLRERVDHTAVVAGVRARMGRNVLPRGWDIPWPFRLPYWHP